MFLNGYFRVLSFSKTGMGVIKTLQMRSKGDRNQDKIVGGSKTAWERAKNLPD